MISHCQQLKARFAKPAHMLYAGAVILALATLAPAAHAQISAVLEGGGGTQTYLVELAGTVMHETFNGVIMSLHISGPAPGSPHPCLVIARGFPEAQTRNAFFWNSEHSRLDESADTITCSIKPGSAASQNIHFFYLSPELLKRPQFTHRDKQDAQRALKNTRPTSIHAQSGELRLTIGASSVSGTVWLQGYDTIEKSYVRYSAAFSGRRALAVDQNP